MDEWFSLKPATIAFIYYKLLLLASKNTTICVKYMLMYSKNPDISTRDDRANRLKCFVDEISVPS